MIGATSEAARYTEEGILRTTIGFIDTTADRTSPGRVARVNEYQRHTEQSGFVFDKGTQLIERPAMQLASLRLPNPYPVTDAAQVFQSDTASGAFGLLHELLGDAVVHVGCEASLLARQGFETTPGGLRSFGLQTGTDSIMPTAQTTDVSAGVEFSVAVHGDVGNAEIDADTPTR